jgi:hypothetical protein
MLAMTQRLLLLLQMEQQRQHQAGRWYARCSSSRSSQMLIDSSIQGKTRRAFHQRQQQQQQLDLAVMTMTHRPPGLIAAAARLSPLGHTWDGTKLLLQAVVVMSLLCSCCRLLAAVRSCLL